METQNSPAGEVKISYPDTMEAIFSNHVQIIQGPDAVFLDFCQIQIQDALTREKDEGGVLRATPKIRMVLTKAQAQGLKQALTRVLDGQEK